MQETAKKVQKAYKKMKKKFGLQIVFYKLKHMEKQFFVVKFYITVSLLHGSLHNNYKLCN